MMSTTQREVNQLYHLSGFNVWQVADELNITQEEVRDLLMSWDRFYKESAK